MKFPLHLKTTEVAWAAGFFDGEGNLRVYKSGRGYYLQARITQVDVNSLLKLKEMFGGVVYKRKLVQGHKQAYEWALTGFNVYHFCRFVQPFVIVKKNDLEKAMKWLQEKYG